MTGKCNAVKNKLKKTGGRLPPSAVTGLGGGMREKRGRTTNSVFLVSSLEDKQSSPQIPKGIFFHFLLEICICADSFGFIC